MTKEMVIELLETAGEDISYMDFENKIYVTVQDFDGFDEDWDEVDREYDEDLVDSIEEKIEEASISHEGDYYQHYYFEDFVVVWGYASYDI